MPWLFAWAFSIPCSLCSSCSLEWLSTSLSMIVGKSQFGMLWCGLLFSWAMESYSAFILKSGMHVSTVLWKIPHFWIMSGHVPGLVVTCFRSLDFVSSLSLKIEYSPWFGASCFQLLLKLSVLFEPLQALQMTHYSILRSLEAKLLEVHWSPVHLSRAELFLWG